MEFYLEHQLKKEKPDEYQAMQEDIQQK